MLLVLLIDHAWYLFLLSYMVLLFVVDVFLLLLLGDDVLVVVDDVNLYSE